MKNIPSDFESATLGADEDDGAVVKSGLWVPMMIGDEVKGVISLQNLEREDAFSGGDVRLLNTIANSIGVAIENARPLMRPSACSSKNKSPRR